MTISKITLMDAYMLETLRNNGVTNDELISQLEKKDVAPWAHIKPSFDFAELIPLYEKDSIGFASVLSDGYTVKFITLKGLQNLLKMKFDKIEERDYQLYPEKGVTQLTMNDHQYSVLKQMLSQNWAIEKQDDQTISVFAVK